MFNRVRELDRPLLGVTVALALFGLAALYSAGQTDVPTQVTTIWQRQIAFLVLGAVLAGLVFRASPRLVEWAAPYVYGGALFLLLLTLVIGTGAGTAAGTKSWIVLGGPFRLQPAELAKLAVVLMVARWAADRRSPPAGEGPKSNAMQPSSEPRSVQIRLDFVGFESVHGSRPRRHIRDRAPHFRPLCRARLGAAAQSRARPYRHSQ